jgi:8-oxo-dGTP diphosphatase
VPLPYQIATLLYCFDSVGRVLLLERAQEPNRGLWSPPGGKLKQDLGESPFACACREAGEELGVNLAAGQLHLTGLISEHGHAGESHWLMFLFEVLPPLASAPAPIREGRFQFFHQRELESLPLPRTDQEQIWPLFWRHRGGFFAAHCRCGPADRNEWTIEQSSRFPPQPDQRA